ncbi:MAG: acyltransferase family protein, partial [Acidothermaceae bacterium]
MAGGAPAAAAVPQPRSPADHGRTRWLDGIRFAAAMFVVLHHCWLWAFPGYPRNTGPWYLGWMLYGQLAVVVFIVVSGYSLTLAPSRNGFVLRGGAKTFASRRAWRILPPYWAALVLSVLVVSFVVHPDTSAQTAAKSFAVYGLLLQDVVNSASPNGAFWSIAVEAQIYLLFPLMLYLRRRYGALPTAAIVTVVGSALEVLAHNVSVFARYDRLTPQLAIDFAFGMAAVDVVSNDRFKGRRIPMLGLSAVLLAGGIVAMNLLGSQTAVRQYFSVEVVVGIITAIAFRGFAGPARSRVREFFQSRPMVAGGRF